MKYLRSYNEGFNKEDYYIKLPNSREYMIQLSKHTLFDKMDLSFLESISEELGCDLQVSQVGQERRMLARFFYKDKKTSANYCLMIVTKLRDDYYLINIPGSDSFIYLPDNEQYKCDQLDGLEVFIDDNKIRLSKQIKELEKNGVKIIFEK